MQILIEIVITFVGLYLVFEAYKMKKHNKVSNFVVPQASLNTCKDIPGLANYLWWKLLVFAFILTAVGVIRLIDATIYDIGKWNWAVGLVAIIAFCVFYKLMQDGKTKYCG